MSSKHIFDSPDGLVLKSLRGAVALNPLLRLHALSKSVFTVRSDHSASSRRTVVISGGGAGHEPAHASYTGRGMLSAAVSGDIFASPSASQILTCIDLALHNSSGAESQPKEVLLIVNNYTGDRLNFGLAAEKARSKGICVETVLVADDVAVGRDRGGRVGRRGLAGNILVCKILGAAAERGVALNLLVELGNAITKNLASIAVSLDHCHVPGRDKDPMKWDKLPESSCELGMGLHNEPGARRLEQRPEPEELVSQMLNFIINDKDQDRSYVKFSKGDQVIVFVNNQGGISQLELGAAVDEITKQLDAMGPVAVRVYAGSYMTSLNAPGFSISLLNVSTVRLALSPGNPDVLHLLDDPTDASAWTGVRMGWSNQRRDYALEETWTETLVGPSQRSAHVKDDVGATGLGTADPDVVAAAIRGACTAVLEVEADLTKFDTATGDGDCGETFTQAAKAVLQALDTSGIGLSRPYATVADIAQILEANMGGTSGAIFDLYLTALSTFLRPSSDSQSQPDPTLWTTAPLRALQSLSTHTPARPGDRTLIDALSPFCTTLDKEGAASLGKAVEAAHQGAEATRKMRPRLGRAVYVGIDERDPGRSEVPDPGAWGVAALLRGLLNGLESSRRSAG